MIQISLGLLSPPARYTEACGHNGCLVEHFVGFYTYSIVNVIVSVDLN